MAIHAAVVVAWVALFVLAFVQGGVLAWSVGIAYIAYDTLLQVFVGWHTWRLLRPPPHILPGDEKAAMAPNASSGDPGKKS